MHLVYDTRTGDVVDGPYFGGGWGPDGIPDDVALVNVPEDDLPHAAVLRLPDDQDGDVLALATTHRLRVEDGQVVAGDPLPPPPPPGPVEQATAAIDQLRPTMLATAQDAMRFAVSVGTDTGDLSAAELTSVVRAQSRIIYDLVRSVVAAELRLSGDPQAAEVITSTVLDDA